MDVFEYRDAIISDYKSFTTSFAKIKVPDIRAFFDDKYEKGQYWPAPLIQLNPAYVPGGNVEELVSQDLLHLVFDFCCRLKMAASHASIWFMKQLPIFDFSDKTSLKVEFVINRSFELTYTANVLKPLAQELGFTGSSFSFNQIKRHMIKSELDAFIAKICGFTSDELRYILDLADVMGENYPSETFRFLKKKEMKELSEYRTQRLVLEAWDKLERGGLF